jgi:predicted enzyme related to lactoylglutathione lyase
MDGVRIDRYLSNDLANGRRLIARLQQPQAHRLSHLVYELAIRRYARPRIQSEVNHWFMSVHMYYYISTLSRFANPRVFSVDGKIRAVMIFCVDPSRVAAWWAQLLGVAPDTMNDDDGFSWFESGGTEYGFHPADPERNPLGGTPVIYLATQDVRQAMAKAIALGATRHRGPLVISAKRSIAQLVDPYGNIFGLDGPSS